MQAALGAFLRLVMPHAEWSTDPARVGGERAGRPWYSMLQMVHHDHPGCGEGALIERRFRCIGTGGRPLCGACARLHAARSRDEAA